MYMCGCLRMSYYASWQNFANMGAAQMTKNSLLQISLLMQQNCKHFVMMQGLLQVYQIVDARWQTDGPKMANKYPLVENPSKTPWGFLYVQAHVTICNTQWAT